MSIGIFFGTETGNTEYVARIIKRKLNLGNSDFFNIKKSVKRDLENYDNLLLGISTWYYGDVQSDWDNFMPIFKKIDFKNKKVGIFGCGDQEDYSDFFCDAMGIIKDIVLNNNGNLIGKWPINNYYFNESKALIDSNYFVGLAIDEDRQHDMTKLRVENWIDIILSEIIN